MSSKRQKMSANGSFVAVEAPAAGSSPVADLPTGVADCLTTWASLERACERMIPLIGFLYRERNIVPSLFGRTMANASVKRLVTIHAFVCKQFQSYQTPASSLAILQAISEIDIRSIRIDIGRTRKLCEVRGFFVHVAELF